MKSKRIQQPREVGGDTFAEEVPADRSAGRVAPELPPAPPAPAQKKRIPAKAAVEASIIETDLQVIVGTEAPIASVIQLPVPPKNRIASLLERLERLEAGLAAVGERLDRVAPPDVRLIEAHDDPKRMSPWNERHAAAAAGLPRIAADAQTRQASAGRVQFVEESVSDLAEPDYVPDEVFLKLQRTVAKRLRQPSGF